MKILDLRFIEIDINIPDPPEPIELEHCKAVMDRKFFRKVKFYHYDENKKCIIVLNTMESDHESRDQT
ncbi:MAG: hypothetical protein ACP5IB_09310 [Thermoplasmata archaeon]